MRKVVAVSGGFDPIHRGHLHLFEEAKSLGDDLVVILNEDQWLWRKKGYHFLPQEEREAVIGALKWVDAVIIRDPKETYDVAHMLEKLDIHIFANGGADRSGEHDLPTPETLICRERGIDMRFNVGDADKFNSSSWIIQDFLERVGDKVHLLRETGKAL